MKSASVYHTIKNNQIIEIMKMKKKHFVFMTLAIVFFLLLIGASKRSFYRIYYRLSDREEWRDKRLSQHVELHSYRDASQVYNVKDKKYTTYKINWVSEVTDGDSLAVYAIPHHRGYINVNNGQIVIDAEVNEYSRAWVFSEGKAAIVKDGKIGFINSHNEIVIPLQYDFPICENLEGLSIVFHNGICMMPDKNGRIGIINDSGEWLVEPSYEKILEEDESGYRKIIKEGKYGLLDSTLKIVYEPVYDCIETFPNASTIVLTDEGKAWQVDYDGKILHGGIYQKSFWLDCPTQYCDESSSYSYAKYEILGKYGIMDCKTGKFITPAIYTEINMVSEDVFEVKSPDINKWFLLDSKGNKLNK